MRAPLPDYPWDAMDPFIAKAATHAGGAVNLSIGSPVDETPTIIRQALAAATDAHAYPATVGTAALRSSIVEWYARRRGVTLCEHAVLPTIGSKELVALLPVLLGLEAGEVVVHPTVSYPSYAVGAAFAGARAVAADDPREWPEETRLVWLNSPGNPDGRVLGVEALRAAVTRARELGATLVADECYAELGWESPWDSQPIPSVLDKRVVGEDHSGVLSIYSLSKQSNLAGYRAAFLAGDALLVERLTTARKHAGLMVPLPVQMAMIAALGDDAHVEQQRERYRERRKTLKAALVRAGYTIKHSEAGLYLWATRGVDAWQSIAELADIGIIAGPGEFYGDHSPNHVRFSLTASDEHIREAADRLATLGDQKTELLND